MTTTLPRPIAREDIRVGDRIRVEWTVDDIERTETATVAEIDDVVIMTGFGYDLDPGSHPGSTTDVTYTLLDRPAPALPTEPGSAVLASRLYGVDYDPPVPLALAYAAKSIVPDIKNWIRLGDRCSTGRWYSPDKIESWTPARIVPADQPEAERRVRPEITGEMVERAALAICNESRRRTGLSPLDRLPWAHSTRRHRGEASAALEAALEVAS